MRSYKMWFILPFSALLFLAGCEEEDFRYETKVVGINDISQTGAVFTGAYWVVGTRLPVSEFGFRYRAGSEGDNWVTVRADMVSAADFTFNYSCDGLEPGTLYTVGSWIKVGAVYYESRELNAFTTEPKDVEDGGFSVKMASVDGISDTGATFKGTYTLDDGQGDATAAGFKYRAGSGNWTTVTASGTSSPFFYECAGLEPDKQYTVTAWVDVDGHRHENTEPYSFTTKSGGAFSLTVQLASVDGVSDTGASFKGTYTLSGGGNVTATGFKYRTGSGNWTTVNATGTSSPFNYTCGGLAPGTEYSVTAWAQANGNTYESTGTPFKFTTAESGTPPEPRAWAELPVMDNMPNVVYVTHYVTESGKKVRNYTLCYDKGNRQAWWAAFPMHPFYDGGSGRNEAWKYDPEISSAWQPNLSSSYNGAYSRGHQVASSDRQRSKTMNQQTFYYSNMAPQIQNEFNGGIWNDLEKKVQAIGFGWNDTLYVVTGEAFIGSYKTTLDNSNNVIPVPTHFYKVLLSSKTGKTGKPISELKASELRCVGFWLGHFDYGTKSKISSKEMMSVAEIEQLTGFTFFPMLSEEAKSVKQSYNASDWAGF